MPRPRLMPAIPDRAALHVAVAAETVATPPPTLKTWQFEWNARLATETVVDDAFASNASATTLRLRAGIRLQLGQRLQRPARGRRHRRRGRWLQQWRERSHDASGGHRSRGRGVEPGVRRVERQRRSRRRWAASACSSTTSAGSATAAGARTSRHSMRWRTDWQHRADVAAALRMAGARASRQRRRGAGSVGARTRGCRRSCSTSAGRTARNNSSATPTCTTTAMSPRHRPRPTVCAGPARALHDGKGFGWTLEAARQHAYAGNPLSFSHAYWLIEPTFAAHGVTYRAGWEHLGGDGAHALQTPLATLHAFNGWADKFTVTPPGGLEDRYVGAGGKLADDKRRTWSWHGTTSARTPAAATAASGTCRWGSRCTGR